MRVRKKSVEQQAIDLHKALITIREARLQLEATNDPSAPLPDQLAHWYAVRQYHELVKAISNEAEALSKHMSYEQLPKAFRASRVNARNITLEGMGRFSLSSRTTAKVLDWARAGKFLEKHKKGDALRWMAPAATMN